MGGLHMDHYGNVSTTCILDGSEHGQYKISVI